MPDLRLEELEPKLTEHALRFLCLACRTHQQRVPLGDQWKVEGEMPNITVHPSINTPCWHGNIVNGEVLPG